jgi:hypothetical protein
MFDISIHGPVPVKILKSEILNLKLNTLTFAHCQMQIN